MISSFLVRTNYLNHYSLNLLIGNLFLIVPALCVAVGILVNENLNFIWVAPFCGFIGWVLVLPSTYTIARNPKERVAVDALSGGLAAMLFVCSTMIFFKPRSETEILEYTAQKIPLTTRKESEQKQ